MALMAIASITAAAVIIVGLWRTYVRLAAVPGPLLASLSDLPRLYWVWTRKPFEYHYRLHQRYGKLVRYGPNAVLVADPAEIPHIYGFNYDYNKSDFYRVMLPYMNGQVMLGSIALQDADLHRKIKKPVVPMFALSSLVNYEPLIDPTIAYFVKQLRKRFSTNGRVCDFGQWIEMFLFDALGEMTFSKRYGFLETGTDVGNIIRDNEAHFDAVSLTGQIPWVDTKLAIGPLLSRVRGTPNSPQMDFQFARMKEWQEAAESGKLPNTGTQDLLSKFMTAQSNDPTLPPWAAISWIATNIGAGSDTTATILRALFHSLLRNPKSLKKLQAEIDAAATAGNLSPVVTWKQTRALPYLDACIKEAERISPSVGLPLERVVPEGGATICGQFLPGGTIVGMNAWAVNRDKGVFGDDVDTWRPERWLGSEEHRRRMDNAILTFGAGSRVCYGKNFAHLIMFKVVPSLLQNFEFEFANAAGEWNVQGRWFVIQKGLRLHIHERKSHRK